MTIKYYHAEPMANSLKCMVPFTEKGIPFESVFVNLIRFEQHEPWFLALNPDGQVPLIDHDGVIINHSSVINEYIEDAFPDTPPLRPADPVGKARMRAWNRFVDEDVTSYVSMHGFHRGMRIILNKIDSAEFDRVVERIPLHEQRVKWRTARAGFSEAELANALRKVEIAVDKVEAQLAETPWLAGDMFTLADINFFANCGMSLEVLFPEMNVRQRAPRLIEWLGRVMARPGVAAALATPNPNAAELEMLLG